MAPSLLTHYNTFDGISYKFEIFNLTDEILLTLKNVRQVYGVVLNEKNQILLVSRDEKHWILPGGTVEDTDGSYLNTLKREVYEESAVVVDEDTVLPFFYQNCYLKNENSYTLDAVQVRFVCRPKRIDEFKGDPDNQKVKYQKWVDIDKLEDDLKWNETTTFIKENIEQFLL